MKQVRDFIIVAALLVSTIGGLGCSPDVAGSKAETSPQQPGPAAASKWEGKLVRRPGTTAEDEKVYFVQNGKRRWVVSGEWIKKQGYKWPDEVKEITASELESIPLGEPVQ